MTQMNWDRVHEYAADARFWLFSRSLLKRICSPSIVVSDYSAGQFLSDMSGAVTAGSRIPIIRWANDAAAPSREHIPLQVTIEDPSHLASVDKDSCPRMFLRARDATPSRGVIYRWTRRYKNFKDATCKEETVGAANRFIIGFDASSVLI